RKQSRSIGLIIRRIIAGFIFLSTISGVVAAIETNSFNEDVIPGVFVSLLIIYYLARSPRNNRSKSNEEVENNNEDFNMDELREEFEESLEELEVNEVETNNRTRNINKSSPVKDKQSLISRIFQGRTDRY
ncbi:MAG: hypothetical protein EBY59_05385, partial [Proteobacteria bacterium]|nr:hypothetical protein [Pseudomonadota bacterium]